MSLNRLINAQFRAVQALRDSFGLPTCRVCQARTSLEFAYHKRFYKCSDCGFIFTNDFDRRTFRRGMGFKGSWSGPSSGGYREEFLVRMLARDLGLRRFLLYGTGNTPTFEKLLGEGYDVIGCDISRDVVAYKRAQHGDTFFTPETLPRMPFDAIIAVEVIEHLADPIEAFARLRARLTANGVICGTTNFSLDGTIEDTHEQRYMSLDGHVAYWSKSSLARANEGMYVDLYELIRPGSVLPDVDFGKLWPNKRVFFIHSKQDYFSDLPNPLPIDRP